MTQCTDESLQLLRITKKRSRFKRFLSYELREFSLYAPQCVWSVKGIKVMLRSSADSTLLPPWLLLKLMSYVNVSRLLEWRNNVFLFLENVMGDILASITISGGWVASGATMVELRSIIPCDSHLPPHCADPFPDQWAGHCWIAFSREGLSERGLAEIRWDRDWKSVGEGETAGYLLCFESLVAHR